MAHFQAAVREVIWGLRIQRWLNSLSVLFHLTSFCRLSETFTLQWKFTQFLRMYSRFTESCHHWESESGRRRQSRQTATTPLNVSRNWYGTARHGSTQGIIRGRFVALYMRPLDINRLSFQHKFSFVIFRVLNPGSIKDNFWNWPLAFHSFSGKRNRIPGAGSKSAAGGDLGIRLAFA